MTAPPRRGPASGLTQPVLGVGPRRSLRSETLWVPWLGPSGNKIWAGMHFAKRRKIADEGHLAVLASSQKVNPFNNPVSLFFQPVVKSPARMFDWLNYFATIKPIEDGMVSQGIIPDDNHKWVKMGTIAAPIRGEESGVFVTISEADYER